MDTSTLMNVSDAANKSLWTIGSTGLFFLLLFLILVKNTRSSNDIQKSKDNRLDANETQSQRRNSQDDETIFKILGPRVDQSVSFLVTTPPSELVPVLHAGAKYTSIQRLLVIHLANMTWEICKPIESCFDDLNLVDGRQHQQDVESGEKSGEKWEKGKNVWNIESILNVTAQSRLGTLEVTFDSSAVWDGSELLKNNLPINQVTIDNWAKDDGSTQHKRQKEECLASRDIDECSLVGNGSLMSMNTGTSLLKDDSIDSKKEKDKKITLRRDKNDEVTQEYTFTSEFEAAKFQTLVLVMRSVGKEVQHLYSALETIHRNSEAYNVEDGDAGGVALDDVIRCLGDITFVRKKIDNIRKQTAKKDDKVDDEIMFDDESMGYDSQSQKAALYKSKRLVIGFVDFVGLLVPNILRGTPYSSPVAAKEDEIELFDSNVGGVNEHQARIRQLVKLRQRVASAAVRVRSYTKAMKVVQEGWDIVTSEENLYQEVHHRLTFDDDTSNNDHDCTSQNECYDPNLLSDSRSIPSSSIHVPQQAYALVSCNVIQLEHDVIGADPVVLIPSLQHVVSKNKDMDFIVISLVHHKQQAATILLYTRCLAPGIDAEFDSSLKRFCESPAEVRNQSLNVCIRIGNRQCSVLSTIFNKGTKTVDTDQYRAKLSNGTITHHFGGNVPSQNCQLLKNYLVVNCQINSDFFSDKWRKVLDNVVTCRGRGMLLDIAFQIGDCRRYLTLTRFVNLNSRCIKQMVEGTPKDILPVKRNSISSIDVKENTDVNENVEYLKEILSLITVPVRSRNISPNHGEGNPISKAELTDGYVLRFLSDDDILRHFIAAEEDLKAAAIRMTKSAAFRGLTFPIDTRTCQIELRKGQFFHQGYDLSGNPVFYFRNMCAGFWRKDIDASISAILYTLENTIEAITQSIPNFKCTLVVLMGKTAEPQSDLTQCNACHESTSDVTEDDNETKHSIPIESKQANEQHVHTNFKFVQRLIEIVTLNYPERLGQALVVPNGGWEKLLGAHGLRRYIQSSKTRAKVKILNDMKSLQNYISPDELIDIAGGKARTTLQFAD